MSMLDSIRKELLDKLGEQRTASERMDSVLAKVEERGDNTLTEEEQTEFNEARDEVRKLGEDIATLKTRKADIEDKEARDAEREALARELNPEPTPEGRQTIRGGKDEPTYRKGGSHSFFQDMFMVHRGMAPRPVAERMQRYENEVRMGGQGDEYRDAATSNFASLVVPQYLPEMFAEVLRAGRVTANLCSNHDLPEEGMTLTIPRGTTGTTVHAQSSQNQAVSETDYGSLDLVINVNTYAGQQDMSRQSIERGRNTDEVIYADLIADYAVKLNTDVLAGPGTGGRHLGILGTTGVQNVTWSDTLLTTVPSVFLRKLGDAIQRINSNRFLPADVIIMHPRRWAWLAVAADSNGRPFVLPAANVPQNAWGVGDHAAVGLMGSALGLPVYSDALALTSTQDFVVVARRQDLHLWEDQVAPRQFRFEETLGGQLTVKLVIANYSAFTAGHHPEGVVTVSGTSLVAPTF